jgi:hypothetical protein
MRYLTLLPLLLLFACSTESAPETTTGTPEANAQAWTEVTTIGKPTARHEAAFIAVGDKAYPIGGRRINPVDIYDPAIKTWAVDHE